MLIAIPAENDPAEGRVAATPETVKKLVGLGAEVRVQTGAGLKSGIPDEDYVAAGAVIAAQHRGGRSGRRYYPAGPAAKRGGYRRCQARRRRHRDHGLLTGILMLCSPWHRRGVCAFAMELMPRIYKGADDGRPFEPGQYRRAIAPSLMPPPNMDGSFQ